MLRSNLDQATLLPIALGLSLTMIVHVAALAQTDTAAPPASASPVAQQPTQDAPTNQGAPPLSFDKITFLKPFPLDQLAFLKKFDGAPSDVLYRDKEVHKLLKGFVPDCTFHYGRDMPLLDALDMVMKASQVPVRIRDARYLLLGGANGPYLAGRGFLWIDLMEGTALGGFFFRPTNGEPTPSLVLFSRQVKEKALGLSQLPDAFVSDLIDWTAAANVPLLTTRYFITGSNRRVLLEHDEDFCTPMPGMPPPSQNECQQINADSADLDETAAYYLDQIHYATNGTAWMIGQDQVSWLQLRTNTCGGLGPDPLACRIRLTREHTHVITGRRPAAPHPGHR